jgi:hypothetical protein
MFLIDDEVRAEPQGQFATREEGLPELRRRASIPWDQQPTLAEVVDSPQSIASSCTSITMLVAPSTTLAGNVRVPSSCRLCIGQLDRGLVRQPHHHPAIVPVEPFSFGAAISGAVTGDAL